MIRFAFSRTLASASGEFRMRVEEEFPDGAFIALTGPSGAGKTTLLRMLAGLTRADEGSVTVDGERWHDGRFSLPTRRRSLGFVFQDAALFPTMTVRENLAFAAGRGRDAEVDALLAQAGLGALAARMPATLSGGESQRVALARALVRRPRLLLLDEPLSALDAEARRAMQDVLLAYHAEHRMSAIMVSHDPAEIVRVADTVVVLDRGRVVRREAARSYGAGSTLQVDGVVLDLESAAEGSFVTLEVQGNPQRFRVGADQAAALRVGERVRLRVRADNPMFDKL